MVTTNGVQGTGKIGDEDMSNKKGRGFSSKEFVGSLPTSLRPCSRKVVVAERGVVEGALRRANQQPRIFVFGFADEA